MSSKRRICYTRLQKVATKRKLCWQLSRNKHQGLRTGSGVEHPSAMKGALARPSATKGGNGRKKISAKKKGQTNQENALSTHYQTKSFYLEHIPKLLKFARK